MEVLLLILANKTMMYSQAGLTVPQTLCQLLLLWMPIPRQKPKLIQDICDTIPLFAVTVDCDRQTSSEAPSRPSSSLAVKLMKKEAGFDLPSGEPLSAPLRTPHSLCYTHWLSAQYGGVRVVNDSA